MSADSNDRIRDHLANERTYLAYLRTALALISLGISVNRFSLYLLERNMVSATKSMVATLVGAERLGIGMAVIGLIMLAWGTMHYTFVYRQIKTQTYRPSLLSIWMLSGVVVLATLIGAFVLLPR